MQFEVECIGELSDDDLKTLSATLVTRVKETKKKVANHIKKDKHLMSMWVQKMSLDPPKALPEEVTQVRNQRKKEFEMALLANPEAFVAFQVNTFLIQLHNEIRSERIKRVPEKGTKQ